jgi:hypothetical protein
MKSNSDFWLTLHKLADDLRKEGGTDDERVQGLIPVLESMPPATLETYLENLTAVAGSLNQLLARCKVR